MSKYDDILGQEWARVFKPFLVSEEFQNIRKELKQAASGIDPMYPAIDDVFKAFQLCPYKKLITVFLTTNPYDKQNDGLAFSSKSTNLFEDFPKVLDTVFNAVETDICDGLYLNREPDLSRWAKQGVLLLNCDLTAIKGVPGAHLRMWHPMIKYLFKFLGQYNTGIIYVLIGKHPHKFAQYLNPETNNIFELEHPMAALKEKRAWDHQGIFKRINEISTFLNNQSIDWIKYTPEWATLH